MIIMQGHIVVGSNMKKKKLFFGLGLAAVFTTLIIWVLWSNTALELNKITVESSNIPQAFDGYIIAHVSDLHNAEIGESNETIINMLREVKPDMIAMTGDIVDSIKSGEDVAYDFIKKAAEVAPCYYVTGNHEPRSSEKLAILEDKLNEFGVDFLHDEKIALELNGDKITLAGVGGAYSKVNNLDDILNNLIEEEDDYTILLAHRPDFFDMYVESGADLVLSGHAHGGQFRLPLIGGLYAPGQGFFPEYDSGIYTEENTSMIVSRGIGNSAFPLRFNNRPEIILVELKYTDPS